LKHVVPFWNLEAFGSYVFIYTRIPDKMNVRPV
jgi:hypothetical protein